MRIIKTHYLGPTDTRGSRIKADDGEGNSILQPWGHQYDSGANHHAAAQALIAKMRWPVEIQAYGTYKNDFYFVLKPKRATVTDDERDALLTEDV
jgi:hypothetical protein